MPDPIRHPLTPADREDLRQALAYGLRYDARGKPLAHAADTMAPLAAEMLIRALEERRFVVMKEPGARGHSAG